MNDLTNLYSFHNASNQLEFFIKTKAANYSKMRNFDLGSLEKNFVFFLKEKQYQKINSYFESCILSQKNLYEAIHSLLKIQKNKTLNTT